jgi:hypothetical protein
MTKVTLVGDRRIGMVAVVPAQIDSMHGNPATFSIGCAGTIKERNLSRGVARRRMRIHRIRQRRLRALAGW